MLMALLGLMGAVMIDFLREAWALAKKKRTERKDRTEKATIAKEFNNRYTYRHEYRKDCGRFENLARRGYAWMCPECNAIHAPTDCTGLTGLQYPRCCRTGEGHRLHEDIRI